MEKGITLLIYNRFNKINEGETPFAVLHCLRGSVDCPEGCVITTDTPSISPPKPFYARSARQSTAGHGRPFRRRLPGCLANVFAVFY